MILTTLILIILKLFKNAKPSYYEILLKWNGANVLCISLRQITLSQQYFSHIRNNVCVHACSVLSNSFVTPWTIAHQVHMSMRFLRQEYWGGCHFLLQFLPLQTFKYDCPPIRYYGIIICVLRCDSGFAV